MSTLDTSQPVAGRVVQVIYEDTRETDSPRPEPPDLAVGLVLYPTESPTGELADVSIKATETDGEPRVVVRIRPPGEDPLASVSASPEHQICDPESGVTWSDLQIRGNDGCMAQNDAGIAFLEWTEHDTSLHASSSQLDGPDLASYLATWSPL